jgi:6-pyruvoyltetrahydropterin/6-carboxytetrahydropterin synthase
MFEIHQEFLFDAAHHFPGMPEGHRYRGLHGHSFRVAITIQGRPQPPNGFVADLGEIEQACAELHRRLDHGYLNEIPGLESPSLETISKWIWDQLSPRYPGLVKVMVARDSSRHGCTYFGPARG